MKQLFYYFLLMTIFVGCQQAEVKDGQKTDTKEVTEEKVNPTDEVTTSEDQQGEKAEELDVATVADYFPIEVGYQYDVLHAMDGLGEGIQVLFNDKDRYFASGHYGSALGFYRVYEVRENEIAIVFEVTEEDFDLYQEISSVTKGVDLYDLPAFDEKVLLSLPVEKGNSWSNGKIIETDLEITINDVTYETIIIDYEDEIGKGYYYAKGKGLVQIEYEIPELSREPMLAQIIE